MAIITTRIYYEGLKNAQISNSFLYVYTIFNGMYGQ